ncbi:hypothetical protein SCANM124S_01010 [Streptomyces canus]
MATKNDSDEAYVACSAATGCRAATGALGRRKLVGLSQDPDKGNHLTGSETVHALKYLGIVQGSDPGVEDIPPRAVR